MNEYNHNEMNSNPADENNNFAAENHVEVREAAPQQSPVQPSGAYTYVPPRAAKEKKKGGAGRVIALALCCSLVGGLIGAGGVTLGSRLTSKNEPEQATADKADDAITMYKSDREAPAVNTVSVDGEDELTASQIYEANVNSTVGIETTITTNYFGYQSTAAASGSGFIISEDGYIVTNYHVVEGENSVTVDTYDGNSYDATVVGYDEDDDVAVLKIDATGLTPVTFGSSDDLEVGDGVVAIGNPLGELSFSLTKGVVSALNRNITVSSGVTMNLIQTDCAINSGNSGGALFNMYGEVVGITNAKYSSSSSSSNASIDNIGFAIPIDDVMDDISSIIEVGYVPQAYIGVTVTSVSSDSTALGVPSGAVIKSVTEGSPADKAGLQENDVIVSVDGNEIASSSEIVEYVSTKTIGDTLTLGIYRQGEELTIKVTLAEKPVTSDTEDAQDSTQQGNDQQSSGQQGYAPYGYGSGNNGSSAYGTDPFSQYFGQYFGQQGSQSSNYGIG